MSENTNPSIEIEIEGDAQIEIVDDTPAPDRVNPNRREPLRLPMTKSRSIQITSKSAFANSAPVITKSAGRKSA
jgi:hypothetical protein